MAANPAPLLARRLLETGVSAILNIYDLKKHERGAFVESFLTTLVNAPKSLWRPVLIVLDEAHKPAIKPWCREVYTLIFKWGETALDLSFTPRIQSPAPCS